MDAFGDLFRGVRAHGSLFGSSLLTPPWSLHFVDGAPLTLCTVLGTPSSPGGWIVPEHGAPQRLDSYETVVVRGPGTFTFVDALDTAAEPIACGEFCATAEQGGTRHRRGWADPGSHSSATTLIVGSYPAKGEISRRLLEALPVVMHVGAGGTGDAVLDHLAEEVAVDVPGQQVVLDRLLDWMLVCTIRGWFDRPGGEPPTWWVAQRDPVVGDALRLLHDDPAAPWTVATLAERVGVSRSTLAKRFTELMDEAPLTYLTHWRMTLAMDLLTDHPALSIAQVGRAVGYTDPFAFSAAFKRVRGVNPRDFRREAARA
ncbi:AraC family transcriptional regulator [Mycolicibacterium obuense]|uniref:Arabinose operon regulatory protein n=1 Tax=Mycolicibacterium obuense TaxID=1807 RepID=A0A0J6W3N3_9MYCO|nr:AraC family transcriptional regulator [Mycolicibacterium obuense]KKF03596.1 cupin [Mycolicibacterium obuense]KMO76368.1 Arabinose operon regulatory protein [Mycolicibacterium obuense]